MSLHSHVVIYGPSTSHPLMGYIKYLRRVEHVNVPFFWGEQKHLNFAIVVNSSHEQIVYIKYQVRKGIRSCGNHKYV